jgi:hypothetical protein
MHVLFLALTIYLVGTTIILYLRPSIMFHPGGTWKEFSLNPDPNHTNMPFWLFSILWAFLSYLIASFVQRMMVTIPVSEGDSTDFEPIDLPEHVELPETDIPNLTEAEPVSKNMGLNKTRNGYYVLNTQKYSRNQVPMYVYYGDSPPPAT